MDEVNIFNYVPIKLIIPKARIPNRIAKYCEYIKVGIQLERNFAIGRSSATIKRNPSLDIWTNLVPDNGKFVFEVIIELPFYLPNFKKSSIYDLKLDDKIYIINNTHCEAITDKPDQYFFISYNFINALASKKISINQIIKLKTLISTQFIVVEQNASNAIENNFLKWIKLCSQAIERIISTIRYCTDNSPELIQDCNNIEKSCPIYILCKGKKNVKILRFLIHPNASPLQPFTQINKATKPHIEKYLNNELETDQCKSLLLKCKCLLSSGEYSSACIIACTACEIALTSKLKLQLKKLGLGTTKIKEAIDNISFSQLIKLLSPFIYSTNLDVKEHLTIIDKLRKIRNLIAHEGKQLSTKDIALIKKSIGSIEFIINRIN